MREITLPEAKPAYEWVNGRALQKVSPKRRHGLAQMRFGIALEAWAKRSKAGTVATEWRFRIQPPGKARRPLVPDAAFLSYRRLSLEEQERTEEPSVAPDAVVEVLSLDDRRRDVEEKVRVSLAAGTDVIFLVDPESETVSVRDAAGQRRVDKGGMLTHEALPGFRLHIAELFASIKLE